MMHYIILRADKKEIIKRTVRRLKPNQTTNIELVEMIGNNLINLKYSSQML
mgnify:CR=1 FL=1